MVFSVRTIFLLVRGINQMGNALSGPAKELKTLEDRQRALAQSGYRLMFAGAAFSMFGMMAARALFKVLEAASLGQLYVEDFRRVFEKLKLGLAEAIIDNFGPMLEGWIENLDNLANNEEWQRIMAGIVIPATVGIVGLGLTLMATGLAQSLIAGLALKLAMGGHLTAATMTTTGGALALNLVIGAVITLAVAKLIWDWLVPEKIKEDIQNMFDQVSAEGYDLKLDWGGAHLSQDGKELPAGEQRQFWENFGGESRNITVVNNFENVWTQSDFDDFPPEVVEQMKAALGIID